MKSRHPHREPPSAAWLALALLVSACAPELAASGAADRSDPGAGSIERGRQALTRYQCGSCHVIPGVPGAAGQWGPSLQQFGRRAYIAGHLPNQPQALAAWIQHPQQWVSGTLMPDMGVSEAAARDMASYLLALK